MSSTQTVESIPSELRKLIRKRTSTKASVYVISGIISKFNSTAHSYRQVQTRLTRLSELVGSFNETQQMIEDLELDHKDEEGRLQFEDFALTLMVTMEDILSKNTPPKNLNASQVSINDSVRLPAIQPPTFNGNFKGMFVPFKLWDNL